MARGPNLIPIALVGGVAYVGYVKGKDDLAAGKSTGLAAYAKTIQDFLGGASSNINQPSAPSGTHELSHGTPVRVTPWSPAGLQQGRQLWSSQHGGDASGFDAISSNDQVVWSAQALSNQGLWVAHGS